MKIHISSQLNGDGWSMWSRAVRLMAIVLVAGASLASNADAAFYYVKGTSAAASDTNAGTLAAPFKTIQRAVTVAKTGDTIYVYEGVYNEKVRFTAEDAGLYLEAGEFAGAASSAQVLGFNTRGAPNLKIEGFTIVNSPSAVSEEDKSGVFIASNGVVLSHNTFIGIHGPAVLMDKAKPYPSNTTLYRNVIESCNQGVVAYATDLDMEENLIKRLVVYTDSIVKDPTYLKMTGSGINVWRNRFFGTSTSDVAGRVVKALDTSEADGGYLRSVSFNRNSVSDFDMLFDLKSAIPNNIYSVNFFNNIFTSGNLSGITVTGYVTRFSLLNNLLYNMGAHALAFKVGAAAGYIPPDASYNNVAVNNIFYNCGNQPLTVEVESQTEWTGADYNLMYSPSGTIGQINAHDVVNVDPRFVNAEGSNFRLQVGSPAIDAGMTLVGNGLTDYDYLARPQGAAWDIGPYEHASNIDASILPVLDIWDPVNGEGFLGQEYVFSMDRSTVAGGNSALDDLNYDWNWDFGDGTTFASASAIGHFYNKRGTYEVTLKIFNVNTGSLAFVTKPVEVWPTAIPNLKLRLALNNDSSDDSGNKVLTQMGGTGTFTYGAGMPGKAMVFNGTSGPYLVAKDSNLLDGTAQMTIGLFAKKAVASAAAPVMFKSGVYRLAIGASGASATVTNDVGQVASLASSSTVNNNTQWHHYCVTHDGMYAKLYIDGVEVDAKPLAGALAHNALADVLVGKDATSNTFNGLIDTVRFYNRALTAAEVQYLYRGTNYGDASLDGVISAYDASLVARYSVGTASLSTEQAKKADVSGDGQITALDASLIARYSVSLIPKFDADVDTE